MVLSLYPYREIRTFELALVVKFWGTHVIPKLDGFLWYTSLPWNWTRSVAVAGVSRNSMVTGQYFTLQVCLKYLPLLTYKVLSLPFVLLRAHRDLEPHIALGQHERLDAHDSVPVDVLPNNLLSVEPTRNSVTWLKARSSDVHNRPTQHVA